MPAEAIGITPNRGQADEIVALQPDLVLTSAFSGTFAARVLERLHLRVERLGFAATREEVFGQIAQVADWTGEEASARQLIATTRARIEASVQQLRPQLAGKSAVFLSSNGIAFGSSTLQDDFLHSVGLRNIAAEAGISGPAPLSLELLLQAAPDFIISEPRGTLDAQMAHPYLQHAALMHLNPRRLSLPDRWFDCAGPWLADAYSSVVSQLSVTP
jgi:iron complex transport system substrate-binding protein